MLTRRRLAIGTAASLLVPAAARAAPLQGFAETVARIEKTARARLGVALVDTATGALAGYRADERFPLCSTFKVLAAAAVLARVDKEKERLDRRVTYKASDLVDYSPVTKTHVADGMTMTELCAAALTRSDNTAGNLLLASIGGPAGLTAYARTLGDTVTRLDRTETTLNEAAPHDPRDTTSPAAMADDLQVLVLGHALASASRQKPRRLARRQHHGRDPHPRRRACDLAGRRQDRRRRLRHRQRYRHHQAARPRAVRVDRLSHREHRPTGGALCCDRGCGKSRGRGIGMTA